MFVRLLLIISACTHDVLRHLYFCYRYDLMVACNDIGEGKRAAPEMLGGVTIKPISAADAYFKKLDSKRVNNGQIISLLERYSARKRDSTSASRCEPRWTG